MEWGRIIMIAIAVALIGLIGTVGISIFNELKGYKKINDKIGNTDKGTLSNQHEQLGNQHYDIEKLVENTHSDIKDSIISGNSKIYGTVNNIDKKLAVKEAEQKYQYDNLNNTQKEIDDHVKGIEDLVKDWKRVNTENVELRKEKEELTYKYKRVLEENNKLKRKYLRQDNSNGLEL